MADLNKLCELGDQSPKDFLPNLKSFRAECCEKIVCISPIAKSQYLQEVWLQYCDTLEEVFKMDEQLIDNSSSTELGNDEAAQPQPLLSNLQSLRLESLDNLRRIIEGPIRNVSLRSLKVIKVGRCSELKFLFSASLVQTLELLEELEIEHCFRLEAVFLEQDESDINETKPNSCFGLPNLKTLSVYDCERLEYLLPSPRARGEELELPLLYGGDDSTSWFSFVFGRPVSCSKLAVSNDIHKP
ncbi:MAG: hypothetical protein Q8807_03655, partial ['Waltheria sp.' little leaf phytoplasma]|nr:hypothetical protein ['Waltheria sp.' little leaf phytoplasma]